jgi:uncharacterized protein YmfQ (DUF2313 family)
MITHYWEMLTKLLPYGLAWVDKADPYSTMGQLVKSISIGFARFHDAALALMVDLSPTTTTSLLSDFEAEYGLPDPCMPPATDTAQRRLRVVGRIRETGGQTKQYLIDTALAYGYAITITEQPYFLVDSSTVEVGVPDEQQHLTFIVNFPDLPISLFRADVTTVDNPLEVFDNQTLECIINRLKPAQTFALFDYTA